MYVGVLRTFFLFLHIIEIMEVFGSILSSHVGQIYYFNVLFFNRMLGFKSLGWLGPF